MEKLTTVQQSLLKKMWNEHLRVKLIWAGFDEEEVMGLACEDLMASYAEVMANPRPAVGPAIDPELEKEKLAFERQKCEAEQKRLKAEREDKKRAEEFERQKWKAEQKRLQENKRREEDLERPSIKDG